ncbi:MAG: MFS transporter, partial [Actinobacteria bacterium]|nr:MFS transporter [Actinomycetota bacterium]
GTGSMALVLADTVASRWFVHRRGLVMGALTAGSATGQLVFLPPVAAIAETAGWRPASLLIAVVALAAIPFVLWLIRDYPEDRGVHPFGAPADYVAPARAVGGAMRRALEGLAFASKRWSFWALAAAFAICGATTNGLVGIHFIPSAHDHGMPQAVAAGLLAVVGIFDIVGTLASGWLTDTFDPRWLLACYYGFRGVGLMLLPWLLSDSVHPSMVVFIVVYGLDWVATVPPTSRLCRELFGERSTIVFGWVFAAHQLGAASAALGAGAIRDYFGDYTPAWLGGAALCAMAVLLSLTVNGRAPRAQRPQTQLA